MQGRVAAVARRPVVDAGSGRRIPGVAGGVEEGRVDGSGEVQTAIWQAADVLAQQRLRRCGWVGR